MLWKVLTCLAVCVGVGVRIYAAWTLKHFPMRDASVPMLMSRHMLQGEPAPVFYYGQAYMGSLEPIVSSWVMRILGPTPFTACLGTVALSLIVLCLTVRFAYAISGPRAAFFTAICMIATSDASLYLSAHPRGGYMVMQACGMGVLYCMYRFLQRMDQERIPRFSWELPMAGLLAGLGWWNLQLVVVYLLAGVAVGIPKLGRMIRRPDLYVAVATFLLGALPWVLWNLRHGGESMSMGQSLGAVDVGDGARQFAFHALDMMGWKDPEGLKLLRVTAGMILLGTSLFLLTRDILRSPNPTHRTFRGVGMHLWVLMATLGIYSVSHFSNFNTSRYLLPLYPSFAILAGVVLSVFCRYRRTVLLVPVLLGFALAQNNLKLHKWYEPVPGQDENWNLGKELASALDTYADGIALGGIHDHWLTVASEQEALLVQAPMDVYPPYNRAWARAESLAVLDHDRSFKEFLRESGGTSERMRFGAHHLHHTLQAPPQRIPIRSDEGIRFMVSGEEKPELMDGDAGTYVRPDASKGLEVEISFASPTDVAGFVLPCLTLQGEMKIRVSAQLESGEWTSLKETGAATRYFWSGTCLVHMGLGYHRQVQWEPVNVTGLKLELEDLRQPIRELLVLSPELVAEHNPDPAMLGSETMGLVAVRSVVDRLEVEPSSPRVIRSSFWTRELNEPAIRDPDSFYYLPAWPGMSIQVPEVYASSSRDALEKAGLASEPQEVGGMVVLKLSQFDPAAYPGGLLPVAFTEHGLYYDSEFKLDRWNRAYRLLEEAEEMEDGDQKTRWLAEALRLCPESPTVRSALGQEEVTRPRAVFENGLALQSVTTAARASALRINWIWALPPNVDLRERSLFVHVVQDGKIVFQDDHNPGNLVPEDLAQPQWLDRMAKLSRTVSIPQGVTGPVEIHIGWIDPGTGKRLDIRKGDKVEKGKLRAFKMEL